MTKIIDTKQVIELLEAQVKKKGFNYVYKDEYSVCENFFDGSPRCIVGHVFDSLELTVRDVGNSNVESSVKWLAEKNSAIQFTDGATTVLAVAQSVQDQGGTWGLALAAARRIEYLVRDGFIKEGVPDA